MVHECVKTRKRNLKIKLSTSREHKGKLYLTKKRRHPFLKMAPFCIIKSIFYIQVTDIVFVANQYENKPM